MKFYDFVDKAPVIPSLTIIEGIEKTLADATVTIIEEKLFAPMERELNIERFEASELDSFARVEAAVNAFPFLATTRLVVVRNAQLLRAQGRRDLWTVAQAVPSGNILVIEDLMSPLKKTKPEPFGQLAGRTALRIDTTPTADAKRRFIRETLERLNANADAAAIAALVESEADLGAIRSDCEKLALLGRTIVLDDVVSETIVNEDAKAYQYAAALIEGRTAEALAIAFEMFSSDPRGAAIPLVSAVATEYRLIWELSRPGGEVPARLRWRERVLRPIAKRLGERRARLGYERALRGFEAIVTGRADDPRAIVELITATA